MEKAVCHCSGLIVLEWDLFLVLFDCRKLLFLLTPYNFSCDFIFYFFWAYDLVSVANTIVLNKTSTKNQNLQRAVDTILTSQYEVIWSIEVLYRNINSFVNFVQLLALLIYMYKLNTKGIMPLSCTYFLIFWVSLFSVSELYYPCLFWQWAICVWLLYHHKNVTNNLKYQASVCLADFKIQKSIWIEPGRCCLMVNPHSCTVIIQVFLLLFALNVTFKKEEKVLFQPSTCSIALPSWTIVNGNN